jgi:hypothetical protein
VGNAQSMPTLPPYIGADCQTTGNWVIGYYGRERKLDVSRGKNMKVKTLLVILATQFSLIACGSEQAAEDAATQQAMTVLSAESTTYVCGTEGGVPVTIAQTPEGDKQLILWQSTYFSQDGWPPETRCNEVSQRFQDYKDQGILNNMTTGTFNGMPVVCLSENAGGDCNNLLITLEPSDNPQTLLNQVINATNDPVVR